METCCRMVISSVMSFNSAPESQSFRQITPNLQLFHLLTGKCLLNGAHRAQWYWHWWNVVDGLLSLSPYGYHQSHWSDVRILDASFFLFFLFYKETRNSQWLGRNYIASPIAHSSFPLYASKLLDINLSWCYSLDMKCLSCRLMCWGLVPLCWS